MSNLDTALASKYVTIGIGAALLLVALALFPASDLGLGYLCILAFAVVVAPRMSLTLPYARFAISFTDAFVILTFLLYGGPAAIFLAAAETLANCLYLKRNGFKWGSLMIPVNIAINVIAASITYLVWALVMPHTPAAALSTPRLITLIGLLAFSQFAGLSALAALFHAVKNTTPLWQTWKKYCFSSSMTQIVGAGIAGLIFKVVNYGDPITTLVAFVTLAVAFFNYRQSINDINSAIAQVEEAELQKSVLEIERRREAEKYAEQLSKALRKEEMANSALRKSERDLQHAAMHDALTGLANRKHFGEVLRKLIERYKKDPSTSFQVLFLDIRSFKNINDALGHTIGDKVLSIAGKRFVRMLNTGDTVARIGGDEFAIILRDVSTPAKAHKVARRIHQSITQPFSLSGNRISIDLNIGIASCDAEYNTPEEILRDADIAMHFAKEREGIEIFTRELRAKFMERARFEMDLRHAAERNELAVNYQPIVSLRDGRLVGFEALLRWHHSEFGMIPPNKFIPIAEQSGIVQSLTVWMLEETARQISKWQKIAPEYSKLMVSVNISGKHLSNDDLIDDVELALEKTGIAPDTLKLEITESSAMENAEHTIELLNRLKRIGVQLSLDDFGTGYSSLSYLHRLPFDTLKIDRSFVYNVGENGENSEILQTIVSLANNLRMRVIAEGIETMPQLMVLQNLGCDLGQGFLLARPKGKEETEDLLYQRKNWLPYIDSQFDPQHTTDGPNFSLPIF